MNVSEFLPFILTEMNWRVYHNGGKLSKMNLVEYWKANSPKLFYSTSVPILIESIVSRHQLMVRNVYMWPWMMFGSNYRTMILYMMWDDTFSKPTPRSPFAKPTMPGLRNSGNFRFSMHEIWETEGQVWWPVLTKSPNRRHQIYTTNISTW